VNIGFIVGAFCGSEGDSVFIFEDVFSLLFVLLLVELLSFILVLVFVSNGGGPKEIVFETVKFEYVFTSSVLNSFLLLSLLLFVSLFLLSLLSFLFLLSLLSLLLLFCEETKFPLTKLPEKFFIFIINIKYKLNLKRLKKMNINNNINYNLIEEKEEKLINENVEEIGKEINKKLLKSDNYFNTLENRNIKFRTKIMKILILIIIILIIFIFFLLIIRIKNLISNLL